MILLLFKRQRGEWFVSTPRLRLRNHLAKPIYRALTAMAPSILNVVDSNMVDDLAWGVFNRLLIPISVLELVPLPVSVLVLSPVL